MNKIIDLPLQELVEPLLTWYSQNARILPWRENTAPYPVWVSEIMLQQTRVEVVKPYFQRFMRELPTVQALARAEEEILLKLWEGLGYYTRVRNLQKAARMICEEYGGVFPNCYSKLLNLPGIGTYTAGAILSICFQQPIAAVDGNVLRVIARFNGDSRSISDPSYKSEIAETLRQVYPPHRSGDFTQSLMELGAIICTPTGIPKCEVCPLRVLCRARANNTQLDLPVKAKKVTRKQQEKTILLLRFQNKIAVGKRPSNGLLGNLWEFPNVDGAPSPEEISAWLKSVNLTAASTVKGKDKKHIFTHIVWEMHSILITCTSESPEFLWVTAETLETQITLPTAFKQFVPDWL